ncbi:guanylate cyclase 32E-like [Agrilus planipennis]|uniref:Guanylate cyclase 32E-like n=1 Tax=Agrilus planipennis TaxID=224129 RepID=A0A7F5RG73_AGRPL|nr:guanylate cyclase 32E-like [Agrilus planipennis]
MKESGLGYGLFPVGVFVFTDHVSPLPVLQLLEDIEWVGESVPIAVPVCGFNGENCLNNTLEIISGITGTITLIVLLAVLFLYRNWKYEQELDSLLWKIDFREIQIKFEENANLKDTKTIHPLVRTSQVSLSSNLDNELRYSTIFTQVGLYKGRLYAVKKVHKKYIDLTRTVKKELKVLNYLEIIEIV